MKKYTSIAFLFLFALSIFSCQQNSTDQKTTDTDDLLELPPEKKVNQAPPKKIEGSKGTSTGVFTHLEQGDYFYLHIRSGDKQEAFMLRSAYQGADKLNLDNWKTMKNKKVKITWEAGEEKDADNGNTLKFQKVIAVEVLD